MRKLLILVVVVALPSVAMMLPATSLPAGSPHVPDMFTKAPSGVRLVASKNASRKLYFANTIGNIGNGPLELRAENDSVNGTTNAIQEIYTHAASKGGGALVLLSSTTIGSFEFHPAHNHWHMGDFAQYELRSINLDGSTGPVVATTKKTSFCMIDTDTIDSSLPHFGMGLQTQLRAERASGRQGGDGRYLFRILARPVHRHHDHRRRHLPARVGGRPEHR